MSSSLRNKIVDAIEAWRETSPPILATPDVLHLDDPDEVKELARAILDALVKDWNE